MLAASYRMAFVFEYIHVKLFVIIGPMQLMGTSFELIGSINHTQCKKATSTVSIVNLKEASTPNLG